MKKLLTTLILALYIFSVSSLTHVFAMNKNVTSNGNENQIVMSHHWCWAHTNTEKSDSENQDNDNNMNCCEILFSPWFSYTKIDLEQPDEIPLIQEVLFCEDNLIKKYTIFSNNDVFSPPWWEEKDKKYTTYEKLIWIIKNLN